MEESPVNRGGPDTGKSKWMPERIGVLSGVIATSILCVSVAFDYFFLGALRLQLSEVPTSISDHVRSGIVWTPIVVSYIGVLVMASASVWRYAGKWFKQAHAEKNVGKGIGLLALGTASVVFVVIALEPVSVAIYFAAMMIWFSSMMWVFRQKGIDEFIPAGWQVASLCVPLLVFMVSYWGYVQGERMLDGQFRWTILLKDDERRIELKLSGIRRFEEVAVLVETSGRITVVRGDSVMSVATAEGRASPKSVICRIARVGC